MSSAPPEALRLDKWLWSARFFKTRSLAAEEIGKGRISVNGQVAKASRELRLGDELQIRQGPLLRTVLVRGLSAMRGPAPDRRARMLAHRPGRSSRRARSRQRPRSVRTARDRRQTTSARTAH